MKDESVFRVVLVFKTDPSQAGLPKNYASQTETSRPGLTTKVGSDVFTLPVNLNKRYNAFVI